MERPPVSLYVALVNAGLVDDAWYCQKHPDVAAANVDPTMHYMLQGWREGRDPNPYFDTAWYVREYVWSEDHWHDPLSHYLGEGWRAGNLPNASFDGLDLPGTLGGLVPQSPLERAMWAARWHGIDQPKHLNTPTAGFRLDPTWPASSERAMTRIWKVEARLERTISAARLHGYKKRDPTPSPFFSLIMPVYQPPLDALDLAIRSVRMQEFHEWELIIVDDASRDPLVAKLIEHHAEADARIRTIARDANGGISAASNQAIDDAQGKYIALIDHDDLLATDALKLMHVACESGADIVYSDEAVVTADNKLDRIIAKPDWSPVLLLACMYIGHLGVYRTELVREHSGFRSQFDFSQDYDLALRLSEQTDRIQHVPEVLYFWRSVSGSAAGGGKADARVSNIAALQAALDRRGIDGSAYPAPRSNQIRWVAGEQSFSVIIPTDDAVLAREALASIHQFSSSAKFEVIIVTTLRVATAIVDSSPDLPFVHVPFEERFNFSKKCNRGAAAATGDIFVFFNDDVRVETREWLVELGGVLGLPGVGAAGPLLVYKDGTIQHAGMAVGVRGLLGTAFHRYLPEDASMLNLASSLREVSVICGAVLSISRNTFEALKGFDEIRYPIAHSDTDLCLRLRRSGMSCVYTPHARLQHWGHESLSSAEDAVDIRQSSVRNTVLADLFDEYVSDVSYDPYFPPTIRDLTHIDFPDTYEIFPGRPISGRHNKLHSGRILIIAHDLSLTGAPRAVLEMVGALRPIAKSVVVLSPVDGPLRDVLQKAGAHVVVDSRCMTGDEFVAAFQESFDLVIANTYRTVAALGTSQPSNHRIAYIHEGPEAISSSLEDSEFVRNISAASAIWACSPTTAESLASIGLEVLVLPPSATPALLTLPNKAKSPSNSGRLATDAKRGEAPKPVVVRVIGSYEPRKGQDLAIHMMHYLQGTADSVDLKLNGRLHDTVFFGEIRRRAVSAPGRISMGGELSHSEYLQAMGNCDILLCSSREESLSLVSVDALAAGKILIASPSVGISQFIVDGVSGFLSPTPAPEDLAATLLRAISVRSQWARIGAAARLVVDANFRQEEFANSVVAAVETVMYPSMRRGVGS